MRFVTYQTTGIARFGVLMGDGRILDVEGGFAAALAREISAERARVLAAAMAPPEARAFIDGGQISLDAAGRALAFAEETRAKGDVPAGPRGETILFDTAAVRLMAPLRPRNFIAAGKNYWSHQQEMQRSPGSNQPGLPIAHVQFASTVVGPDETVRFPPETKHMDYEVELAVVIGRPARDVARADAMGHVFGYTVYNDITDRDMYRGEYDQGGAFGCLGKNFPGFSPLGPVLCTPDEVGDPLALKLKTRINGETRQDGPASLMMYKIDEQIAHWSRIGLAPGDLLGTGTPGGVAAGHKGGDWWLKPGDVMECEIEKIGTLRTTIGAVG